MTPRPNPITIKLHPNVIILLHGFNSGPGNKATEIKEFLIEKNLTDQYLLIAPQIDYIPNRARRDINKLIRQNKSSKVHIIGTSLGGFYANYFRAKFNEDFLSVHAINPSWEPSKSLANKKNQILENFKSNEKWEFKEEYLAQLEEQENFIKMHLKNCTCQNYHIHLSRSDEMLNFDKMLSYLEVNNTHFIKKEYDSDHRFRKIKDIMAHIIKD